MYHDNGGSLKLFADCSLLLWYLTFGYTHPRARAPSPILSSCRIPALFNYGVIPLLNSNNNFATNIAIQLQSVAYNI